MKKGVFMRKGQISLEYLIIIAFIVFVIIGLLASAFFYSNLIRDNLKFNQIDKYANNLLSNSESIFYAGEPSKITINAYLPAGVEGIEFVGNYLVINLTSSSGIDRMSYKSNVPIEGALSNSEGLKRIVLVAESDKVVVNEN